MPAPYAARLTQKPTIEKRRTCSNCGRLGHLLTTCENPEAHHHMLGIEIEGWWFDLVGIQEKARTMCGNPGTSDGSLRSTSSCTGDDEDSPLDGSDDDTEDCENGCDDCPHPIERSTPARCSAGKRTCKACGARGWELKTRPGSVGEALRQLTTLYPDVTSRAAGMHVHMSFKDPTSVTLLCSDGFFKHWTTKWEAWGAKNNIKGAFWERLRNENNYCRPANIQEFTGKKLVTQGGDKYRQINFLPYDRFQTVEFRLLPMFQKGDLGVLAIEQLVDIVESYLQNVTLDKEVELTTKVAKSADEPLKLDDVVNEIELPPINLPEVKGEVDLETPCKMGAVLDDNGNPTGVVRIFRYQVDTYLANAANDAVKIKQKIADPKAHKVKWENFDTTPRSKI